MSGNGWKELGVMASVRFLFALLLLGSVGNTQEQQAGTVFSREGLEFFEKKIRPILADRCYRCHSGDKVKAELYLDSRDGMLKGGESGPAVVPGEPEKSLLIHAIRHGDDDLD